MRKTRPALDRFDEKWIPEPNSGCWLWLAATQKNGYGYFCMGGRGTMGVAHRASWRLRRGPIPAGLCVLHKCDTPCCVNPDHLFLGTQADNMADCAAKGRNASTRHPERKRRGETHPLSKLTRDEVIAIRAAVARGERSQEEIAARFGVVQVTVSDVALRRTWRHVS